LVLLPPWWSWYVLGPSGRSKEWKLLDLSTVRGMISAGKEYIACRDHKTASTYGAVGKYLSPGTMEAIKDYIELPKSTSGRFLEPTARSKSKSVCVADCLRRFGSVYMPDHQAPGVNLLRKWYHTAMKHNHRKALQLVARIDAHSESIADSVYAVSTPEQDAARAKDLVEVMLGGPVGPPSLEDFAGSTVDDLLKRFARCSAVKGEDEDSGQSEESEAMTGESGDDTDEPDLGVIDLDDLDKADNLPPRKRARLVGFPATGSAASSSSGPGSAGSKAGKHHLTPAEKTYILDKLSADSACEFSFPEASVLTTILQEGMTEGLLSWSITHTGICNFLRSIEHVAAEDGLDLE